MSAQQERVSLLAECLQNIKTIKIFSWVDIFEDQIKQKRYWELKAQLGKFHLGMIGIAFVVLFPQLMSTLTIIAFIWMGNTMEISTAFTVKLLFNQIRDPMRSFPLFISQYLEFRRAMSRIQEFLTCDEINTSITNIYHKTRPVSEEDTALEFKFNGNYHWGVQEIS